MNYKSVYSRATAATRPRRQRIETEHRTADGMMITKPSPNTDVLHGKERVHSDLQQDLPVSLSFSPCLYLSLLILRCTSKEKKQTNVSPKK